jgi:glycogen(starch) synthase
MITAESILSRAANCAQPNTATIVDGDVDRSRNGRRMRILVLSNYLPPGRERGYELACYNLSKGLRNRGHELRILTSPTMKLPAERQDFVDRELAVREFTTPALTGSALHLLLQHEARVSQLTNTQVVLAKLRAFRPDHVLMFNLVGVGGLAILDLVDSSGIPWTMNLGDWVPHELITRVPDEVQEVFDVRALDDDGLFARGNVAAVSQKLLDEISRADINLGPRVTIVPRGVAISDVDRLRDYRADGITKFVSAGAVAPQKGIDFILEATKLLQDENEFDFSVDVYGGGAIDHYARRAQELGISDRLKFRGHVSQRDVVLANAAADAFLFPTWSREPGASVVIEAAVVGAVPIVTGTCGPAERFVNGMSAIKIRRTVDSLADAMRRVGRGEVDLAAFAVAGARLAAGDLSFEVSVDRLETVLNSGSERIRPDRLDDPELDVEVASKHARALEMVFAAAKSFDPPTTSDVGKD